MAGGEVFLNTVGKDIYHGQEPGRFLPMMLEVGEDCLIRLDLSAFDRDGVPGTPTLAEFRATVKAKLQNNDRWSMLVVNNANHSDVDEPTDFCLTFDADGLVRRLDDGPVIGDPMLSLNQASQNFDPRDQPGGYVLPAELTLPADGVSMSSETIVAEIDADLAELLGGTALSGQ